MKSEASTRINRTLDEVYAVIARMPAEAGEKSRLKDRARRYQSDCGCGLSGVFLVLALLACMIRLAFGGFLDWRSWGIGVACVVCAPLAGKVIGIGWARARLAWMRRSLARRLADQLEGKPCRHAPSG